MGRLNPNIGAGTGRCYIVFSVSTVLCIDLFHSTHKGMTMGQRFLSAGHLSAMFFCLATRRCTRLNFLSAALLLEENQETWHAWPVLGREQDPCQLRCLLNESGSLYIRFTLTMVPGLTFP